MACSKAPIYLWPLLRWLNRICSKASTRNCSLSRLGRAEALVNLNRDDEAFSDLTAIWSTREQDPQANYLYALILTKIGDADKAQKVLEKAALGLMSFRSEYVRRHPPSLLLMGILHFGNQHYDEAFPLLDRYVQLDPGNAAARKLLAAIMLMRVCPRVLSISSFLR